MSRRKTGRLELHADEATDDVTTCFDVTVMAPEVFDRLMESIGLADESPANERLANLPRLVAR